MAARGALLAPLFGALLASSAVRADSVADEADFRFHRGVKLYSQGRIEDGKVAAEEHALDAEGRHRQLERPAAVRGGVEPDARTTAEKRSGRCIVVREQQRTARNFNSDRLAREIACNGQYGAIAHAPASLHSFLTDHVSTA